MKKLTIFLALDENRLRFAKWSTALVGIYTACLVVVLAIDILKR